MVPDLNDYSLLATKLTVPQLYADVVIPRPRLYERLTIGTQFPLSIIAAPAGSGKTTLFCDWLRQRSLSIAWVSLEERDNDCVSFWSYILAALKKNASDTGETQSALFHLSLLSTHVGEDFFIALINALMTLPEDVWLALDDYHKITSPVLHSQLEFLLEHMPPRLRLILISRTVPPLPLVQLRARGQLFELQALDLSFTVEETAQFFKQSMSRAYSIDEVIVLNNRTEGWITGLRLAVLSLERRHDFPTITNFLQAFSGTNRSILHFLTEEVLACISDEVQFFLLATSIVKSFNASLCNALTERYDSDSILDQLEQANLFLVQQDGPPESGPVTVTAQIWYRYHILFGDVLRYRLNRLNPELLNTLYYRASCWYEQHNMLPEAVEMALLGERMDFAADLIERCAWSLILQGQTKRITAWMLQLAGKTATLYRHHPLSCMLHAIWQLRHGNIDKFKRLMALAEWSWQAEDNAAMLNWLLCLRAYQEMLCGNSERAIAYAQQALNRAHSKHLDITIPLVSLGIGYLQNGNVGKAYVMLTTGYRMSKRSKNTMLIANTEFFLGDFFYSTGNLQKAAEHYQYCIQDTDENIDSCSIKAYTRLAELCYEWNDFEGANYHLQQSIDLGKGYAQNWLNIEYYLLKAQLVWQQKSIEQAFAFLEKAEIDALRIQHRHYPALILLKRIHYLLAIDKQDEAVGWLRRYEECRNRQRNQMQPTLIASELYCQARTRILIAQNRPLDILKELELGEQNAHNQGRVQSELSFLVLLAQAYHLLKDIKNVKRVLERILTISEEGHYIRTLLDEGDILLTLFTQWYDRPQKRVSNEQQARRMTYVHTLLHTTGYVPAEKAMPLTRSIAVNAGKKTGSTTNQRSPIGTLSEREQEVLKLIAEGHSNQQIARILVVAESTIKTHLNNIYTKLHVNSRLQALTRAHACGLLEVR